MTTIVYKSAGINAVNIDNYIITPTPGLQVTDPITTLDRYVGTLLTRYTDGVLDPVVGEDSLVITASANLTSGYVNGLINANHASTPIVGTILSDALGGFSGYGSCSLAMYQAGAAAVSFVAGAGVTIRGTPPTAAQYTIIGVVRVSANTWAYL